MAKIEDIKRAAQNAAYTATEKAQGVAAAAGEKAGVVKEVAKTNISLVTEKRNLEKSYQALGEWFAAQCGDDVPEGAEDMIAAIRLTQEKLEKLKTLKSEQDMSARELLDRGIEYVSEKAEALMALAKKPLEGRSAHELVDEGVEAFAEKAEAIAEEAAKPADIDAVHELVDEGVEAFAEKAEAIAEEAAKPADIDAVHELVDEGVEKAAELLSGGKDEA